MSQAALDTLLEQIRTRFVVEFEDSSIDDIPLYLLTVQNMTAHLNKLIAHHAIRNPLRDLPLWAKVWPASFVLGRFLRKLDMQGKSLLEVGAGCGVSSCIAARYGFADIVVSDISPDALQFAQANILKNGLDDRVSVCKVDVASDTLARSFDCIAGAEIMYLDDLHRPLIKFCKKHLAEGGKVLFCTDIRRKKGRFLKWAAKEFTVSERLVGTRSVSQEGEEERCVYAIHTLERT